MERQGKRGGRQTDRGEREAGKRGEREAGKRERQEREGSRKERGQEREWQKEGERKIGERDGETGEERRETDREGRETSEDSSSSFFCSSSHLQPVDNYIAANSFFLKETELAAQSNSPSYVCICGILVEFSKNRVEYSR